MLEKQQREEQEFQKKLKQEADARAQKEKERKEAEARDQTEFEAILLGIEQWDGGNMLDLLQEKDQQGMRACELGRSYSQVFCQTHINFLSRIFVLG